jgi:hypothetical protein
MEITNYLQKLVDDPQLLRDHHKDPRGTMQKQGLSQASIDLIASKDVQKIRDAVNKENPGRVVVAIVNGR